MQRDVREAIRAARARGLDRLETRHALDTLSMAQRHAGGKGVRVAIWEPMKGDPYCVVVTDAGHRLHPANCANYQTAASPRLPSAQPLTKPASRAELEAFVAELGAIFPGCDDEPAASQLVVVASFRVDN